MHESPDVDRRKIGKSGCLFGCLGLALLFVVLPLLVLFTWSASAARSAQERLDNLQARGYPTTAEELDAFYALPDGEVDRTKAWMEAVADFQGDDYVSDTQSLPIVGAGVAAPIPSANAEWEQLDEVAAFLAKYHHGMALMHESATQNGKIRFDHDFNDGLQLRVLDIQQLLTGARMLQLEAHLHAHRRNPEGVTKSLRTMMALSLANALDPITISQLTNTNIRKQAFIALEKILPYVDFTDEQLAEIQSLFTSTDSKATFKRVLVGERALGTTAFRNPRTLRPPRSPSTSINVGNEDLCFYLDLLDPVVESISASSWLPTIGATQKMKASFNQMSASQINKLRYPMTNMLLPPVELLLSSCTRADAECRIAEVACALQRYRNLNGQYPPALDALAPKYLAKVPLDPYDDRPLRYELRNGVAVLWSIGRDQTDNGGVKDDAQLDICFELKSAN